jgi:hypothetical protein
MGRSYKVNGVSARSQLQSGGIAAVAITLASVVLKYASPPFGREKIFAFAFRV